MNGTGCFAKGGSFGAAERLIEVPCNNVVGSLNAFTGAVQYSSYGYNPTPWAVYLFTALNVFALAAHIAQGLYWRTYWTLPTLAGGSLVEVIGWAGRIWSVKSTVWDSNAGGVWFSNYNGFLMQIVCLVIAPTFFSAANYVLLNRLIRTTGGIYSSVTAESFTLVFIVADVLCIIVQGAGGGIAGSADTLSTANTGAYIMTGGVCLQLVITVFFAILYVEFIWRFFTHRPSQKQYDIAVWFKCGAAKRKSREAQESHLSAEIKEQSIQLRSASDEGQSSLNDAFPVGQSNRHRIYIMTCVLGFSTLLITIRGVYRSVELSNGWEGPIAVNEALFLGMDSLLMALFILAYVAYHPGLVLSERK